MFNKAMATIMSLVMLVAWADVFVGFSNTPHVSRVSLAIGITALGNIYHHKAFEHEL